MGFVRYEVDEVRTVQNLRFFSLEWISEILTTLLTTFFCVP